MAIFNAGNGNDTSTAATTTTSSTAATATTPVERICSHVLDAGATGFLIFPTSSP
jgi:hypothetical protein